MAKKVPIPGTASEVDVAATNNNNVVVASGGRVLVSTNALGAYTLTNITRNLPGRFVVRVAFDPNDPATTTPCSASFSGFPGGHVFRTTIAGTTWTDISPQLDLPFNAIALDGSETPTTIYAGTDFGVLRSVDGGANWSVLDDSTSRERPCSTSRSTRASCGPRRSGVAYSPSSSRRARRSPSVSRTISPLAPSARDRRSYLTIEVSNVGVTDLVITSVQRLMGSTGFAVLRPGNAAEPCRRRGNRIHRRLFATGTAGLEAATIRIITNTRTPGVDMAWRQASLAPARSHRDPNAGSFGNVCLGSIADRCSRSTNAGVARSRS